MSHYKLFMEIKYYNLNIVIINNKRLDNFSLEAYNMLHHYIMFEDSKSEIFLKIVNYKKFFFN